ncbi:capsular polysaccharide biosynthesis protein CapF [Oryzomonas sagensis]|uniref:Capsular polysaccharide biosynthesis protein CapF n=1 Tax=Oryzomonas sagensis TaxID=2603857 RepID=A0ABQ6TRP5_9BACT|nr:capsular polysaccharide biosynthesis protein CapF [Oryzomonas sagensis]KAB0671382.1 capsular polysaccharide biosynthesis protein CapF [Oryzomonas sagensis]
MKTVLITGSEGFIGKNLRATLQGREDVRIICFDVKHDHTKLPALLSQADFVFHLAGVNRPQNTEDFRTGNTSLTEQICRSLANSGKIVPIAITSSIQAALDNLYGASKRGAEEAVFSYGRETGAAVHVFRLPNVFGKWCRPNYNSVVATFCNNIANGLPIQLNDPNVVMNLVYIDDVVRAFVSLLDGIVVMRDVFCVVEPVHTIKLGYIVELIRSFQASRDLKSIPNMADPFVKKLYSTYLSYLPKNQFSYQLKMNIDKRGSFTEFIKTPDRGQVSVNISKPGITKGNHWHHTKNEKFLVVSGQGIIRFRRVGSNDIIEYPVSGDKLEVVDIPTGYTHNISNTGTTDLVTVMWCNEMFDPENPDTFFEPVERGV